MNVEKTNANIMKSSRAIVNLRKLANSYLSRTIARDAAHSYVENQTWIESLSLRMRSLATRTDKSEARTRGRDGGLEKVGKKLPRHRTRRT
jgi:hypothetical protein